MNAVDCCNINYKKVRNLTGENGRDNVSVYIQRTSLTHGLPLASQLSRGSTIVK